MTSTNTSKEEQIKHIQALGVKLAELRDIKDDVEFLRKGGELARDIFNLGFANGKNAGYSEGYDAAVQEMKGRIDRRLQEYK